MLDPRRLQALHAVATTGSVKEAAAALGYSSSAISQQISALERETSSVLLEPAGRGVRPTPAGELLSQHAERIFEQLAQAESELIALNAGQLGSLRLASFASAGAALVPPALAQVRAELPALEVTLRNADPEDALALLRRGLVDVALIELHGPPDEHEDGLAYHFLLPDPYRLLLPKGHRLATRDVVRLADAREETWVDLRLHKGCCRVEAHAAFERAGFTPHWVAEADDYSPAQGFVAAGLGLALLPSLALGVLRADVVVRPLTPDNEPRRDVYAVTRSALTGTTAVQSILAALTASAQRVH
ncbi:LysR substrate-binding domain-containing protein [Solirubrobacter phytolaccae]|uniref:LysR substrate-binding domain-containing protein n=1 Tax=Solirubrobacter phytolaccae TaxID=1404360 RepID=A0A9X3N7A3_9ACTN|nr:LysR family transcriptional regulator [Solirubrobacter phytolaccae]MDA0179775.1 LysR substrate-binding domain-containing protein [Solirubrobacter phytolaccae]